MSEEWYFYPCRMGDHRASIFYDHGIRDAINRLSQPHLLKLRVALRHPRPDGLSSAEEYEALSALDDELTAELARQGAVFVGRITVAGHRHFHCYADGSESEWISRLSPVGGRHGYALGFALEPDAERSGYWRDLFPTEDDWQVIQDLKVLESARTNGDDATIARSIEHWAYFPDRSAAQDFSAWAQSSGYGLRATEAADDGRFCVRLSHEGTLYLDDITSHTINLRRRASALGGDYDGWETPICRPPDE
jgi:hypothetical protein